MKLLLGKTKELVCSEKSLLKSTWELGSASLQDKKTLHSCADDIFEQFTWMYKGISIADRYLNHLT